MEKWNLPCNTTDMVKQQIQTLVDLETRGWNAKGNDLRNDPWWVRISARLQLIKNRSMGPYFGGGWVHP